MLSINRHDIAGVNNTRRNNRCAAAAVGTSNIVKLNLPESNICEIKRFSDSLFKNNWEASIVFKTIQNGNAGVSSMQSTWLRQFMITVQWCPS